LRTLDVAATALNAALYAVTGYIIYFFLPITTPGIGIVRFWPNVVIPAVFAVLFGPLVGGFGAAVGIFISDVLIHGDPLLSLSAGVTSNFLGFYLIGYVSKKNMDWTKLVAVSSIGCLVISLSSLLTVSYVTLPQVVENRLMSQLDFDKLMEGINPVVNGLNLFTAIIVAVFIITMLVGHLWVEMRNYVIGSIIGLGLGSAIIGLVVWAYSQVFILPSAVGGGFQLPLYATVLWFIWTFATEIPFLVLIGPPIIKVCEQAFPSLKTRKE